MRDFRELEVWKASHELTVAIYRVTGKFPSQEMYGLVSQLRRAAVSVEANIAEGAGKQSHPEFARFLQIGFASASEVECELLIAHDLGFLSSEDHRRIAAQVASIKKMLTRFIQYLQGKSRLKPAA